MIGQRHRCPHCRNLKTNEHSVTFNSWDPRIVQKLPSALAAEFPACLSHHNAIADSVLALMCTCFQYGMGSKQFSNCLQVLHHRYFDTIHAQYLDGILSCKSDSNPLSTYQPFGTFNDSHGYSGFVPSSKWLREMYDKVIEDHGMQLIKRLLCALEKSVQLIIAIRLPSKL